MVSLQRFQSVLGKPYLPPLFFFSGVTYDTLVLTRIDRLRDNLLLLAYLSLLGFLIVLTGRLGTREATVDDLPPDAPLFMKWVVQAKPYAPMAIQFLLGGLFSAYAIFYSKSATFAGALIVALAASTTARADDCPPGSWFCGQGQAGGQQNGQLQQLPPPQASQPTTPPPALPATAHDQLYWAIEQCRVGRVPFTMLPDLFELSLDRVEIHSLNGLPLISTRDAGLHGEMPVIKRAFDIVVVSAGLVVCAIPMLIIAAVVEVYITPLLVRMSLGL